MQITPINNTTNFNGSVHESFERFINSIENREISALIENAAKVDKAKIQKIHDQFIEIKSDLNEYMSKFHPDTTLERKAPWFEPFVIRNSTIGADCNFVQSDIPLPKKSVVVQDVGGYINILGQRTRNGWYDRFPRDLQTLREFVNTLKESVDVKTVEKVLFIDALAQARYSVKHAIWPWNKLAAKIRVNKIFKYKEKTGIDSDDTKESFYKEINDMRKREKKAIEKAIEEAKEKARLNKANKRLIKEVINRDL